MAKELEPIEGKVKIDINVNDIGRNNYSGKFVEESFNKNGTTASVVKIISDALTGLVDATGKGQIKSGQAVSAKELTQMYNNNMSLHGEDVKKIIREVIRDTFATNKLEYKKGSSSPSAMKIVNIPEGYDDKGKRSVSFDLYKPEEMEKSSLSTRFLRNLETHSESIQTQNKGRDKDLSKLLDNISKDRKDISYQAYKLINKQYYDLVEDIKLYWANKREGIFSELGDMNSRSTEEIEKSKARQSYEDYHYAGWTPAEDEEYLAKLIQRYEREEKKSGNQRKKGNYKAEDYFKAAFYQANENMPLSMEDSSSEIRNVFRFSKEGEILNSLPSFDKLVPEEQKGIFENLTELSDYLNNYGKNFNEYLSLGQNSDDVFNAKKLRKDFEEFLINLSTAYQDFYDSSANQDPRFATQMKMRIQSMGQILGSIYNPNLTEEGKEQLLDNLFDSYLKQIKGHTGSGGNYYEPNAKRSMQALEGFKVSGRYSTSQIPQILTGSLPYFPLEAKEYNNVSMKEILSSPKEYSLFDNPKMRASLGLLDKIFDKTRKIEEGETLSQEENQYVDDMIDYLNRIYSYMDTEEKNVLKNQVGDKLFESEGKFSYVGDSPTTQMKYISDKKNYLTGDSLDKAISIVSNYINTYGLKRKENVEDDLLEIESLKKLLNLIPNGESITKKGLEEKYNLSNENDEIFEILDKIDLDALETVGSKEIIPKSSIQKRISNLEKTTNVEDLESYKELLSFLQEKKLNLSREKEEKDLIEKLTPYLKKYFEAKTSGEKGSITKSVSKIFGKDSKELEFFNKNKGSSNLNKFSNSSFNLEENQGNKIFGTIRKSLEDFKEAREGIYNITESDEAFINSITRIYKDGEKDYSGIGLNFQGKIGFVSDFEKLYETLSSESKNSFLKDFLSMRNNLSEEQREKLDTELFKEKNISNLRGSLRKDVSRSIQPLSGEKNDIEDLNKSYQDHANKVEEAVSAENNKIIVSENLSKVLNKEQDSIVENNKALENHEKNAEEASDAIQKLNKVTMSYEPIDYDDAAHRYVSKLTGEEVNLTATEAAGIAFTDFSSQSKEDFKRISAILDNAMRTGADFTPEALGILDKNTGKPDIKQWNNIIKGQSSTLLGTLFHKTAELGAVYGADTLEGIRNNASEEDLNNFNKAIRETTKKLQILGIEFSETELQDFLTAYMDLKFPMDENGKRNIEKPILAETPLGARFTKGNKSILVGATADALFSGAYGNSLIDFKTGKVSPEKNTFQLSLNSRIIEEAFKANGIEGIDSSKIQDIMERSIYHYMGGVMTKINYGQLNDEMIYTVLENALEGKAIPKEQRGKYNLESIVGRQTTYQAGENEGSLNSREIEERLNMGASEKDREIYRAMLNDIKKIQQAKKQISILDVAIQKSSGSVQDNLIKQKEAQEKIVEEAENAYNISKSQLQLDKTKSQLLENEKQRSQRVGLSDAEINAAAEKERQKVEKKIINEALKAYKSSNKSVYDQEVDVRRAEINRENYTGNSQKEIEALDNNIQKQRELLALKRQDQAVLDGNILKYKDVEGQWKEIVLNAEQLSQVQKINSDLTSSYESKLAKVNAKVRESVNLFDQLVNGIKRSLTNLIDYSLAGMVVGGIRQSFNEMISQVKQLDAALIDLQIAAGTSKEETSAMLIEYNDLAKELGRTTQEVATASNDWLRAGYEGQEASELTKASMELSTLGMTDAASATTNLISVMKGWKLEVEDVSSVVDKLTVIICGVYQVIGIGHEFKCR